MNQPTPPTLDYSATPPRRLSFGYHLAIAVVSFGAWAIMASILFFVIPRFEVIFKDFKMELPAMTKAVLVVSRLFSASYGWLVSMALPAAVIAIGILIDAQAKDNTAIRRYTPLIWILAILLTALLAIITVFALFLPYITLIETVSKN